MSRQNEVRELTTYNRWANTAVLDAVATLSGDDFQRDLGSSFPSIRDTLVHLMSAEWVWLERLNGRSTGGMPDAWKSFDLDRIRTEWLVASVALERFAAQLDERGPDRVVDYRNTEGQSYAQPVAQILRHVVNHASYHRGQVTTMLRQLGAAPPSTDLIRFYRTLSPQLPTT